MPMPKRSARAAALFFAGILLILMSAAPCPAAAAGRGGPDHFGAGSARISLLVGSGRAFDETYTVVGAGIGYYVVDNVEIGLGYESWSGGKRHIDRTTPSLTYVVPAGGTVRPYIGAFYRRTSIEQHEDENDAGARAGALFLSGRRAYIGVGGVVEKHLACDRTVYDSCMIVYPELLVAFVF